MESKSITAEEADEIFEKWARQSLQVCFAVRFGGVGGYTRWLGPIHNGQSGRWTPRAEKETNVLCTTLYKEIDLVEDEEFLGIRFRNPIGVTTGNLQVALFIGKRGDFVRKSEALLRKIFT
jgi:hypothetical protein